LPGIFVVPTPEHTAGHQSVIIKADRTKLYDAIGLGRNLRYSDSPAFYNLQYFIQHYLSDATFDLEFRHGFQLKNEISEERIITIEV
jgi:hypothetical protein